MQDLTRTAVVALATLFATSGPLDVGILFASLTAEQTARGWPPSPSNSMLDGLAQAGLFPAG